MSAGTRLVAARYRLERRIGAGAMGVVWRAHDERLDRTVAIKELLMQPGLTEEEAQTARARSMREGRIAARLQHPHAISVYDVALDWGTGAGGQVVPWLVMEYLPARSLAAVLAEQGTLAPHATARVGRQVATALAAAHEAGIVHRDIKPGNVLLSQNGTVKITDFGISRASWDATVTHTGVLAGTPAYFAPEVARGEPPGPASDVFSLGSTLYAAVEGEPPFGLDDNTLAMLQTVAAGRVRPPQRAGPLSTILMRLLADDPAARPSMPEVVAELGAVAAHGASPVAPPLVTPSVGTSPAGRSPRMRTVTPAPATPTAVELPASRQPNAPVVRPASRQPDAPVVRPAIDLGPWWRRPAVLFGTAACVLLLAIMLGVVSNVAVPTSGGGQLATTSEQPPAADASPLPAPDANALPAPPQPAQPQAEQLEQTVRTYYGLLPEDTFAAWQFLGAAERAKGLQRYNDFWSGIERVSIRGPIAVRGNTVLVNLIFEPANRKRTLERYRLTMGNSPDGRILIDSATRISGSTLAAAKPNG
ncbi:MAG: protein kinase [Actinomycetota bacterium]|nr:protein kinase [Actinomycetota bacterium]